MNTEPGAVFDAHVRAEFVACSVDATMAAMTERPAAKGLICDSLPMNFDPLRTRKHWRKTFEPVADLPYAFMTGDRGRRADDGICQAHDRHQWLQA